jgi:hypothetical protein
VTAASRMKLDGETPSNWAAALMLFLSSAVSRVLNEPVLDSLMARNLSVG